MKLGVGAALLAASFALLPSTSYAQFYGEQAPLQFKYVGQGLTIDVYRRQFMAAQATASATAAAATSGGQNGSQLNNAVQLSPTTTLNLNVSGTGNTLNVTGDTVTATQNSSGTNQTSANTQTKTSGTLN